MHTEPDVEEWQKLYQASRAFRDLEPWTYIGSNMMFAIQNPEDGEMGYCSVMGKTGNVIGLFVYLGKEGWNAYLPLLEGKSSANDPEFLFSQKALMVSFIPEANLDGPDYKAMQRIGMDYENQDELPVFRSYEPGYFPWYLTGSEARFLTTVINQATDLLKAVKVEPALFEQPEDDLIFSRICTQSEGKTDWFDRWLPQPKSEGVFRQAVVVNEIRIQRIFHKARIAGPWEVDVEFTPHTISESGRPMLPRLLICVDHDTSTTVLTKFANHETYREEFVSSIIERIEDMQMYPNAVIVKHRSVGRMLRPLAEKLKIPVFVAEELRVLEEAKKRKFDVED